MSKPTLIVVGGATASGKTDTAIRLAQHFQTEIISADSRQFYREMSIGTAKPTADELAAVKHHFINTLSVTDDYSVGDFEQNALQVLDTLFKKHEVVVMAGGSGLYIQALCEGLNYFPKISLSVLNQVKEKELQEGILWLQKTLQNLDPEYFELVDQNNPARLRRAVEVCLESGQPFSSFTGKGRVERPFQIQYILLERPRAALYERINLRVDQMITAGLEAEARTLLPFRDLPALRTVGYEEWFAYFDGVYTHAEAIDKIKQHTRNYAKRQATWFKKYGNWTAFHPDNWTEILKFVSNK